MRSDTRLIGGWSGVLGTLFPRAGGAWLADRVVTPVHHDMPPDAYRFFTDNNARRLPYGDGHLYVWSWGRGPVVVLVHGWQGRAAHFNKFIVPMLKAGLRVVTFDGPAHGFSTGARSNLFDFVGALEAVADAEGPVAGIVAHAFGAPAAVMAARHGLVVPKLVLVAPTVRIESDTGLLARRLGFGDPPVDAMRRRLADWFSVALADLNTDRLVDGWDLSARTSMMVVHDRDDERVPWRDAAALARLADAPFLTTHGLGHQNILRSREVAGWAAAFILGNR